MPDNPTWDALVHEHQNQVMGPLWLDLLEIAVRAVTPRYPPSVYSETGEWNEHARENLVQDVAVHQLLDQGQLAYIVATATSTPAAIALLRRVVRRTLGHSRRRTVIDNLLDRCRALRTLPAQVGPPASNEYILAAARDVARLPRMRIHSDERAPTIYPTDTLHEILNITARHLGSEFSERDLARIFEHVLTSYLPSVLVQGDAPLHVSSHDLSPDQETVVADVLAELLVSMTPEQRTIVAMKLSDHSDSVVAHHIGVSRPTAVKRFQESTGLIAQAVADLPTRLQDAVLVQLPTLLEPHAPTTPSASAPQAPPQESTDQ